MYMSVDIDNVPGTVTVFQYGLYNYSTYSSALPANFTTIPRLCYEDYRSLIKTCISA